MNSPVVPKAKWLVTGGSGFLGLHLCRYLRFLGHDVVSFDLSPIPAHERADGVHEVCGDIRNIFDIEKAIVGCSYVVHCAAALALEKVHVINSTNIAGTIKLLNSCGKHKIKRLVYISSTAVYGVPKHHPIYEDAPLNPMGNYGISKAAAEKECFSQNKTPALIIRPKSFIGSGRLGIFQVLFDWIESGKRIYILGNGNNKFQLLAVDDLVKGIVLSVANGIPGQIYNLGATSFGTINQDVGALLKHAKTGSRITHIPAKPAKLALSCLENLRLSPIYRWVYDTADKDSYVSTEKANTELGWHPAQSNSETLIHTYDWYLSDGKKLAQKQGTSHRVAWKQGLLKVIKHFS